MRFYRLLAAIVLAGGLLAIAVKPRPVNPPVDPSQNINAVLAPPVKIQKILRRSCWDCHSDQTRWPWYSRLEPFASLVSDDVEKGRAAMNFSRWTNNPKAAGLLLAGCAAVETGRMPRLAYRLMHRDATLSAGDVQAFCGWTREQARRILTMSQDQEEPAGE
jgi:hypothetical protein